MNPALDHLPPNRLRELQRIVGILFEEFKAVLAGGRADWKRGARIVKVILFGSHARGDWVDDPIGGYRSDYDILVVVNDARPTDPATSGRRRKTGCYVRCRSPRRSRRRSI